MKMLPHSIYFEKIKGAWPHLARMRARDMKNVVPEIIIGGNNSNLILARELPSRPPDVPIGWRTPLGWTIPGPHLWSDVIALLGNLCEEQECPGTRASETTSFPSYTTGLHVDDCLTEAGLIEACKELRKDLSEINEACGFHMCTFNRNSREVLESIPVDLRADVAKSLNDKSSFVGERVLGMLWNLEADTFGFGLRFHKVPEEILSGAVSTKRQACSLVMSVYDPLGLVNHFKIKGIMLLQRTWISEIDWDREFLHVIYDEWLTWLGNLKEIVRVKVPRCYDFGFEYAKEKELHVFVDASPEAYSSIAYLGCLHGSEEISVALFGSKARVALVQLGERKRTIPQLELHAEILGSRFAVQLKCELNSRLDRIVCWSDSKVVLFWIRADDVRHKEFEPNRVGPKFLMKPEKDWPQEFNAMFYGITVMTVLEPKVEEDGIKLCRCLFVLENFITLSRLLRRTEAVQRAASYWSQKILKSRDGISTPWECAQDDRKKIIKYRFIVNSEEYDAALNILVKGKAAKQVKLARLSPVLLDGVICLKIQVRQAKRLLQSQKTLAILPSRPHFIELVIQAEHERYAHQETETVLNNMRKKFWIVNGPPIITEMGYFLITVWQCRPHLRSTDSISLDQLRDTALLTALKSAENIVNSRPINYVSSDPTEEEALTPNNFLNMWKRGFISNVRLGKDEQVRVVKFTTKNGGKEVIYERPDSKVCPLGLKMDLPDQNKEIHGELLHKSRAGMSQNSREVLESIPVDLRADVAKSLNDKSSFVGERVLGMLWNLEADTFGFGLRFHKVPEEILSGAVSTKRQACSLVMSVYDPLGLVNHFKIKGIMLLQRTWISEIDWDREFLHVIYDEWLTWLGNLKEIVRVKVPRCYDFGFEYAKEKELHVFVDASPEAYSSIAYLGCLHGSEEISVALFGSKARVALVQLGERKRTIPQLELHAEILGSRFAVQLKCELNSRLDRIVCWSDSKVVLFWIRADDVRHKEFEPNRVGPKFLMKPEKDWPQEFNAMFYGITVMTVLEPKVEEDGIKLCRCLFVLENFITLSRLLRRTEAVQRAASYWSQKILKSRDGISTPWECAQDDRKKIIKYRFIVNSEEYDAALNILVKGKAAKQVKLARLSPVLLDGVICLKIQVRQAKRLLQSQKTLAILPSRPHFIELVIQAEHERYAHQETETVLNNMRKKFWIVNGPPIITEMGYFLITVWQCRPHLRSTDSISLDQLRDTALLTALKSAENIVNSRPINYVSSDPTEEEALTPNNFLLFFVDEQHTRNMWKRGFISNVRLGKDEQVRVVKFTTKNGGKEVIYERPDSKVCPLGLKMDLPDQNKEIHGELLHKSRAGMSQCA
ncbi:hypothetical protein LAZ67_7001654 [Cordylochernes scorpioides]|uniref:Uncharacterized protein n=1 Tax=Cordylochernes scorpioides TaxID=51811 RepID=A0ABY6KNE6_9ARAC|nr:hypothetical protein LAZ67_7001654 [Cordylochernes scorpioides]